jgi:hypothetical protein
MTESRRSLNMTHKADGRDTNRVEQPSEWREHVLLLRHELAKDRKLMEARVERLDSVIGDIDIVLENGPRASGPVKRPTTRVLRISRPGPDITVAAVRTTPRGDGYWDVAVDTMPPFRLPPLLGRLFDLLAKDTGQDIGDGLIGFKTNAYLLTELQRLSLSPDSSLRGAGRLNAKGLAQAVCDLRKQLGRVLLNGDALVQTRKGVGRRIVLRKRVRPIGTDAS